MEKLIIEFQNNPSLKSLLSKYDKEWFPEYNDDRIYFIWYLKLLYKTVYSNEVYNPLNLEFKFLNEDDIFSDLYIINIYSGFTNEKQINELYDSLCYHYNQFDKKVDKLFWIHKIFTIINYVGNITSLHFTGMTQVIYVLCGLPHYKNWKTDYDTFKLMYDFFFFLLNKLEQTEIGNFI